MHAGIGETFIDIDDVHDIAFADISNEPLLVLLQLMVQIADNLFLINGRVDLVRQLL